MKEVVKELETDEETTETSGDEVDDDDEKEKNKMEEDRLRLIKSRIRKPKRKLMKLLRDLENDDVDITNLKALVKAFLVSEEKEIDRQLRDVLNIL